MRERQSSILEFCSDKVHSFLAVSELSTRWHATIEGWAGVGRKQRAESVVRGPLSVTGCRFVPSPLATDN